MFGTKDAEWENVRSAVAEAKAMHFDGCHKIYLSMDAEQVARFEMYGYDTITPDYDTLKGWYDESCFLKFVQSVRTVKGDPNYGYTNLIDQGFEDDDEDDYDEWDSDDEDSEW